MHKKKPKAMISIWSDEDSDESQEEDDNNVSQIVFTGSLIYNDNLAVNKTAEFVMTDFTENFVTTDAKHYMQKHIQTVVQNLKQMRKNDKMYMRIYMHSG